jgi:shikimate kinase/3-dehydroquinate synthase
VIVLVGFMAAGKTTVGRRLAERLGLPFVDADAMVEERAGTSIPAIFAARGETGFRALELEVVRELLDGEDAVVALGGGAPESPATRAALRRATTVFLDVGFEEAMARLGDGAGRPMLAAEDPKALFVRRRALYRRIAGASVATNGRAAEAIAEDVVRVLPASATAQAPPSPATVKVPVPIPRAGYEVVVGAGVAADLAGLLPPLPAAERAFVITHPSLAALAGPTVRSLESSGLEVTQAFVDEGESSKTLATSHRLLRALAEAGLHRGDVVVGFGGGVITDIAGYVASVYMRGVALAQVATSLLAQVDAAIGGKTAVNLEHARNLVGTIHQPVVVVCDVDLLATLPRAELVSGLAEVVKYGLIVAPDLLAVIEAQREAIARAEPCALAEIVTRSVGIKASIVAADEREQGERAHLNYGHTWAHAIEHAAGYGHLRHGEAVALGMMAAAHLALVLGRIGDAEVEAHRRALASVQLPTSAALELERLERAWAHDKKYRGGVRFVLLSGLGRPEAGIAAPREAILRAVERLGR